MNRTVRAGGGDAGPADIEVIAATKRFGPSVALDDVDLHVAAHRTVALLGPSGCGKTTLLRSVAGLERLDAGTISIGGTVVSGPNHFVAPERRHIGLVFQDWALFPHMSVKENVAYGLDRAAGTARVNEALDMVGLDGFGDRMPSTLSGGQQQRVALARALAPRPRALLLDEPFSNLDSSLRAQIRTEVHALLKELGVTTIFVTHDQEEAFVLGDEVAVMRDGQIRQFGSPADIYNNPVSPWVATFVGGANLLAGTAEGDRAATAVGSVRLATPTRGPVTVLLRPEQVVLSPILSPGAADAATSDSATAHSATVGVVDLIEYHGHDHVVIVELADGTRVVVRAPGPPRVAIADQVSVAPTDGLAVAFADT